MSQSFGQHPSTTFRHALTAGLAGLLLLIATGCGGGDSNQPADNGSVERAAAADADKPAVEQDAPPAKPRRYPPPEVPPVVAELHTASPGEPTDTFLDRPEGTDLRFVCWNVLWNNIFVEENAQNAERFARVIYRLNPDIVALQEVGVTSWMIDENPEARPWDADDVRALMDAILPLPEGQQWHAYQGRTNVLVSRFPLAMTRAATEPIGDRGQAIALVDLPDGEHGVDLYVMNNHYKCCDPEKNDPRRQAQSDAIVNWIRDARTAGGEVDLPPNTPIIVAGDLNIVGSTEPVRTLVEGDIADEQAYGADFAPDWDDSPMTDLHPRHNLAGSDDYTWRNDLDQYDPGRLDYIIYTDSVLDVLQGFVLNTTAMPEETRAAAGLEPLDVVVDGAGQRYDHLPLVADFRIVAPGEAD